MNLATELSLKVAGKCAVIAVGVYINRVRRRQQEIRNTITIVQDEWKASAGAQSLYDRYSAGKLSRKDWVIENQTQQAKLAWLAMSVNPNTRDTEAAEAIRKAFPHARSWV